MYVAVKGGEKAIDAAHALQESRRRGDTDLPELSVAQIEQQLNLAVDRVMTEGGIADRELAALALKQASGDNVEAIFLLRAYRTTLAKLAVSEPLDTTGMRLERRISAVYKDIPGGQLLGPTYDYTHRLLDFTLLANGEAPTLTTADSEQQPSPHVFSLLARQGLAKFEEDSGAQPDDITRTPPVYPCSRSSRLQQLMRGDEGYLLALAYSTQRGYGRNHPFAGEIDPLRRAATGDATADLLLPLSLRIQRPLGDRRRHGRRRRDRRHPVGSDSRFPVPTNLRPDGAYHRHGQPAGFPLSTVA